MCTVLLVEDEEAVRTTMRRALERMGYEVIEAQDGVEALLIAAQRACPVDLLFTDIVLPRLHGPDLAAALQARWPGLAILFTTGYAGDNETIDRALATGAYILHKPFGLHELSEAVAYAFLADATCC